MAEPIIVRAKNIQGLLPSLDRRATEVPFIIDGRNIEFSIEGPVAAWAAKPIGPYTLDNPDFFYSFEVNGVAFTFNNDAVYQFDLTSGVWVPQFIFTSLTGAEPWSMGFVGGKYYFSRLVVGLLEYNPTTKAWTSITSNVPVGAFAVADFAGRLLVLGTTDYAWSALDDGTDLTPSLTTGAGTQPISIIGGTALALGPFVDGFFVYTTSGVIRATYTGAVGVFRHRPATYETKLRDKFSLVVVDKLENIVVTEEGLFTSVGQAFTELDPIFNENLKETIAILNPSRIGAIRLTWDFLNNTLFISISTTDVSNVFGSAHVYSRKFKKFGQFNWAHYGFGHVYFDAGANKGLRFGYIDNQGEFLRFTTDIKSIQTQPVQQGVRAVLRKNEVVFPTIRDVDNNTVIVNSVMECETQDQSAWLSVYAVGWYSIVIASGLITALVNEEKALDAVCEVGLFRFTEQKLPDELSTITTVAIGAGQFPVGQTTEDWNILTGSEDWNTETGFEDWGAGIQSAEIYSATIKSFNDGFNVFNEQINVMDDDLINNDGATAYFSTFNLGVWHSIRLLASTIGHSFHLKFLELSGILSGRI